ncbi:MAG: prepilin-type N-terminal cleavage/methylation domain-containing protein, partial [Planctomycetota bacterium]|nr:prepilin-type N-terminal cleavage/methylation domain-containing protein [Planctomycetota bacterium]
GRIGGFTLLEILIALVVLTVGLCGIIALFPAGVYSTRESMEDTTSSQIAESVYAAVVVALREAPSSTQAIFFHDGTLVGGYTFNLPPAPVSPMPPGPPQLIKVPTMNQGTTPAPNNHVFLLGANLGGANYLYQVAANIKDPPFQFDATESYGQYSYAFDIVRLGQQPLYEVRIGVYRNYEVVLPGWPVSGQGTIGGSSWGQAGQINHVCTAACVGIHAKHPNLRHVFRALAAGH